MVMTWYNKYIEKIKSCLLNALLVCSLLVFFIAMFGKYRPTIIMSDSMYPVLKTGQVKIAEKVSSDDIISIGDVYMYQSPEKDYTITHRCIGINGAGDYIFKGDNNEHEDKAAVKRSWIRYRLVSVDSL